MKLCLCLFGHYLLYISFSSGTFSKVYVGRAINIIWLVINWNKSSVPRLATPPVKEAWNIYYLWCEHSDVFGEETHFTWLTVRWIVTIATCPLLMHTKHELRKVNNNGDAWWAIEVGDDLWVVTSYIGYNIWYKNICKTYRWTRCL